MLGRSAAALLGSLCLMTAAWAAGEAPLSKAQIALFESNHLGAIGRPTRIEYAFRRDEPGAAPVLDRIELDIRAVREDGRKDVWIDFLTGERHLEFAPALGFNGNPLLMYALERDVMELNRRTGGSAVYFRNRIRRTLVDQAALREISIALEGQAVPATSIVIAPFRDEARLERFAELREKTYEFVVSDAVPGMLFEIRTRMPGANGAAGLTETITFAGQRQ